MSYQIDKVSTSSDSDPKGVAPPAAYNLDEKRRAALAEVDNAKFSYVFFSPQSPPS